MVNKINYTLVGLFFVIAISAMGITVWWLNGRGDGSEFRSYYAQTNELPSGIKKDSLVKFIGVDAGRVGNIKFSNEKDAIIEIELLIKKDLPVKTDSVAKPEFQGITGLGYLNVSRGSAKANIFGANEKAIIKLEASALSTIGDKASDIGEKIDRALNGINKILNNENIDKISKIIENVESVSLKLNSYDSDLKPILRNANEALISFQKLTQGSNNAIENINLLVKSADESTAELTKLGILLQEKIASGEYDLKERLDMLTENGVNVMSEIRKALKEFRNALFRLEDNPYEFFFKNPKDEK